jgi:hypothetical protein
MAVRDLMNELTGKTSKAAESTKSVADRSLAIQSL